MAPPERAPLRESTERIERKEKNVTSNILGFGRGRRLVPITAALATAALASGASLDTASASVGTAPNNLYTPVTSPFIVRSGETTVTLNPGAVSLASVQSQLDSARSANPSANIVLRLAGTYTVTQSPLSLPSDTSVVLTGTIQAASGASAAALVSATGVTKVSFAGGTLEGNGANLAGISLTGSAKAAIDGVTVRDTGRDGIDLGGNGNTSWDSGSAITRSAVSNAGGDGILVSSITQALVLDNYSVGNAGAGIHLTSAHGSVMNNSSQDNAVGIQVDSTDNLVAQNDVRQNRGAGIGLGSTSANNNVMANTITGNGQTGIDLGGTNNLVYYNTLGNAADLVERGPGNWVLPHGAPLAAAQSQYFFPPTIDNQHSNQVVDGRPRIDVTVSSSSISAVQQTYNAAVAANPSGFVVLHMNGSFSLDSALTLNSYTAVVLNGTITDASAANPLVTAPNPVSYVSFSGGTIDCAGRSTVGIYFAGQTMTQIDQVAVRNCGSKTVRNNSASVRVGLGSGYNIIHGATIDTGGGRGIWTCPGCQQPLTGPVPNDGRYVVFGNHVSNMEMDGVDFDSFTSNSVALDNLVDSNIRYGVFVEEGAAMNNVVGNVANGDGRGLEVYANVRGPTNYNSVYSNQGAGNGTAVRVGDIPPRQSNHNYLFDNVLTGSGTGLQNDTSDSMGNYFSRNALSGNLNISAESDFFNPPDAGATGAPPPTVSPCGVPSGTPTASPAGPGSVSVSWTASGGPCQAYAVYAYSPTAAGMFQETAGQTSVSFSGLQSGNYYTFTVIPFDGSSWVAWSAWSSWVWVT